MMLLTVIEDAAEHNHSATAPSNVVIFAVTGV
jgi:hypothetical protein